MIPGFILGWVACEVTRYIIVQRRLARLRAAFMARGEPIPDLNFRRAMERLEKGR